MLHVQHLAIPISVLSLERSQLESPFPALPLTLPALVCPHLSTRPNLRIACARLQFQCCGVRGREDGYRDWQSNVYFNCSEENLSPERCGVPYSCCVPKTGQRLLNLQCGYHTTNKPVRMPMGWSCMLVLPLTLAFIHRYFALKRRRNVRWSKKVSNVKALGGKPSNGTLFLLN